MHITFPRLFLHFNMTLVKRQICITFQIHFDAINLNNDYECKNSYQQSKLANLLFGR